MYQAIQIMRLPSWLALLELVVLVQTSPRASTCRHRIQQLEQQQVRAQVLLQCTRVHHTVSRPLCFFIMLMSFLFAGKTGGGAGSTLGPSSSLQTAAPGDQALTTLGKTFDGLMKNLVEMWEGQSEMSDRVKSRFTTLLCCGSCIRLLHECKSLKFRGLT